ncbi:MAG TPA: hypothetical protein VK760_14425 [Candidatus Acidoferrales bacterium]|nr:hypothetical protein [Candidatus Acidoferrales bacterium]
MNYRLAAIVFVFALAACAGNGATPPVPTVPGGSTPGGSVVDGSSQSCTVSYDGVISYSVPAGGFSPIDVKNSSCARSSLTTSLSPARPSWSIPHGVTQTRFVATSLQEAYTADGMQSIAAVAAPHRVPVSWMVGSYAYLANTSLYQSYHAARGDDVESENNANLVHDLQVRLPWYVPTVSVEGAGHERNIRGLMALGEHAFWGITWNSHGTDRTFDYGAPWGSYCADPASYKRPQPDGSCDLLAFEWTARDLTRAYLSGHEEYFSTDPDDLRLRAQFSTSGAQTYIREIADAYAAAGETQPIVMMSQQESAEDTPDDAAILDALYGQAVSDGMKVETLATAATDARTFSAAPRAVAFPYIPGGIQVASSIVGGQKLYPATIDYHDTQSGMTFLAGHTLPTRVFRYADDTHSAYDAPFPTVPPSSMPSLTGASVKNGKLALAFSAPVALHFAIALWSDPSALRIAFPGAVRAGRAGVVVAFELQEGPNQIVVPCAGCRSTTFAYSR